jgi:hypothetical protein
MGLVDDLRAGLEGVGQLVEGGRKVANAAGAVADRVDVVLEHVTNDETVARVAQAALGAGIEAAGHEIRTVVSKRPVVRIREREPRKRARECLGIACSLHGNQAWAAWRKTIVCGGPKGCGRVYQTANAHGPHFARAACACGLRLLPLAVPDGNPSSAEPICSICFDETVAGSGRATRTPGGRG